jgi:hypothetical protein
MIQRLILQVSDDEFNPNDYIFPSHCNAYKIFDMLKNKWALYCIEKSPYRSTNNESYSANRT